MNAITSSRGLAIPQWLLVALLLMGSTLSTWAIYLPGGDSWNTDFAVTVIDTKTGLELEMKYRLSRDADTPATLHAKTLSEPKQEADVSLTQVDARYFHDLLRTAVREIDVLSGVAKSVKTTPAEADKSLKLRIATTGATLEFSYIPLDRPRSDSAANCYFWMLSKLPADWQNKVSWRAQFNSWTPEVQPVSELFPPGHWATIRTEWNHEKRTVKELQAPGNVVERTAAWRPNSSPPLKPTTELIALALSRVNEYGLLPGKEISSFAGIDWRQCDSWGGWYLTVYFRSTPKETESGIGIKDGEDILAVPMLPDGTAIKVVSRPLTEEELNPTPGSKVADPFSPANRAGDK